MRVQYSPSAARHGPDQYSSEIMHQIMQDIDSSWLSIHHRFHHPLFNATDVGPDRMYAVQTSLLLKFAIATFQSVNGTYQRSVLDNPSITKCSLQWCAIAYEIGTAINSTLGFQSIWGFPLRHGASHHAEAVLWKTFPLALLFRPLEGWNLVDTKTTGRDEMEKIAPNMSGQLMSGKDGVLKLVRS